MNTLTRDAQSCSRVRTLGEHGTDVTCFRLFMCIRQNIIQMFRRSEQYLYCRQQYIFGQSFLLMTYMDTQVHMVDLSRPKLGASTGAGIASCVGATQPNHKNTTALRCNTQNKHTRPAKPSALPALCPSGRH